VFFDSQSASIVPRPDRTVAAMPNRDDPAQVYKQPADCYDRRREAGPMIPAD